MTPDLRQPELAAHQRSLLWMRLQSGEWRECCSDWQAENRSGGTEGTGARAERNGRGECE